jgi:hypothetical protein
MRLLAPWSWSPLPMHKRGSLQQWRPLFPMSRLLGFWGVKEKKRIEESNIPYLQGSTGRQVESSHTRRPRRLRRLFAFCCLVSHSHTQKCLGRAMANVWGIPLDHATLICRCTLPRKTGHFSNLLEVIVNDLVNAHHLQGYNVDRLVIRSLMRAQTA